MLHLWMVDTIHGYMVVAAVDEESVKEMCLDSRIIDIDHLGYAVEGTKEHVICCKAEKGEGHDGLIEGECLNGF